MAKRAALFIFIFVSFISGSLSAGVVYASKWQKGDQAVCLYGDNHGTGDRLGTRDNQMLEAFLNRLEAADEPWLLLIEDYIGDSVGQELRREICLQFFHRLPSWFFLHPKYLLKRYWNFLPGIRYFISGSEYKLAHVKTKNIDGRAGLNILSLLFDWYVKPETMIKPDRDCCEKLYKMVKNTPLKTILFLLNQKLNGVSKLKKYM